MAKRQWGSRSRKARDGFSILELLVVLAIIAILILLLLPAVSFSGQRVLVRGVVLYRGQPVDVDGIQVRPVLADGSFGDQAYSRLVPERGPGRFESRTTTAWRERNPTTGEFAVTLFLDAERLTDDVDERRRLESFRTAETSALRIEISEEGADVLRIELAPGPGIEER